MTSKITFDPAAPKSYDEGSYASVTANFYDSAGTAAAPTSIRYRVEDVETEKGVLGWTTATAAATVVLSVNASYNVMQDESNRRERKQLTVEANQGTSTAMSATTYYDIINRLGI